VSEKKKKYLLAWSGAFGYCDMYLGSLKEAKSFISSLRELEMSACIYRKNRKGNYILLKGKGLSS
jgi:hypothetical protein